MMNQIAQYVQSIVLIVDRAYLSMSRRESVAVNGHVIYDLQERPIGRETLTIRGGTVHGGRR